MSSRYALLGSGSDLRVVLVGQQKVGKSSAGNTILGKKEFDCRITSSTLSSKKIEADVLGRRVSVVDTPGLSNTQLSAEEVEEEMLKAVKLSSPGPHVFLLVLQLGRFTQQEQKVLETLKKMLRADVSKKVLVLFTYGDRLEDTDIDMEKFTKTDENIQNLLKNCSGVYHVFNNREMGDRRQVQELLDKVDSISEGGHSNDQMRSLLGRSIWSFMLKPFNGIHLGWRSFILAGLIVCLLCYKSGILTPAGSSQG